MGLGFATRSHDSPHGRPLGAGLARRPPRGPGAGRSARSRSAVRALCESRAHAKWLALGAHQPGPCMWAGYFACRSCSRGRARTASIGQVEPTSGSPSRRRGRRDGRARTDQGFPLRERSGARYRTSRRRRACGGVARAGPCRRASSGDETLRSLEQPIGRRSDSRARGDRSSSERPRSRSRERASRGVSANAARRRTGRGCSGPLGGGRRRQPRRAADR